MHVQAVRPFGQRWHKWLSRSGGEPARRGTGLPRCWSPVPSLPRVWCTVCIVAQQHRNSRSRMPYVARPELVRQANWRKVGGGSPPRRRSNQPRLSASRASGRREGSGEASVAAHVGRAMSIEKTMIRSVEAFSSAEGNTGGVAMVRGRRAPRCQRTHARMKAFRRDLGDLHPALVFVMGPHREGENRIL